MDAQLGGRLRCERHLPRFGERDLQRRALGRRSGILQKLTIYFLFIIPFLGRYGKIKNAREERKNW